MKESIKKIIEEFPNKKVAVIGDFYLDEYLHGTAESYSPEAPVPRVIVKEVEHAPGCAGNIAAVLKSLGAQVYCAGVIGNDEKGSILKNKLLEKGIIITGLVSDKNRFTGVFSRLLLQSAGKAKQHFVRFDFENTNKISESSQYKIKEYLENILPTCNLLFVADYDENNGKGLITSEFLKEIMDITKKHNIHTIGVSREKIAEFKNFNILVCNKKEAGIAVGMKIENNEQLRAAGLHLLKKTNSGTIIITKSKDGMAIFKKDGQEYEIPSYAADIVDVCGAGDALSSAYGLSSLTDASEKEKGLIASHSAAVAVSKPGTSPVFAHEVIQSITGSLNRVHAGKVITNHAELVKELGELKKRGSKIILTNGYFDLIHSGQIKFLKEAKAAGGVLVVAINSDRSTKENKGEGRPILNHEERANILSSLSSVDYVTIFDELTPVKIISLVKPDILIKGGNYTTEEVIGKDIVELYGGKVEIVKLENTTSTQKVIDKIRNINQSN